jgi:hypothetical protein
MTGTIMKIATTFSSSTTFWVPRKLDTSEPYHETNACSVESRC